MGSSSRRSCSFSCGARWAGGEREWPRLALQSGAFCYIYFSCELMRCRSRSSVLGGSPLLLNCVLASAIQKVRSDVSICRYWRDCVSVSPASVVPKRRCVNLALQASLSACYGHPSDSSAATALSDGVLLRHYCSCANIEGRFSAGLAREASRRGPFLGPGSLASSCARPSGMRPRTLARRRIRSAALRCGKVRGVSARGSAGAPASGRGPRCWSGPRPEGRPGRSNC